MMWIEESACEGDLDGALLHSRNSSKREEESRKKISGGGRPLYTWWEWVLRSCEEKQWAGRGPRGCWETIVRK